MKNRILKIMTAVLLLMTLTMTNFLFVGSSLISYAIDNIATNHQNVEFDAYFKDAQGNKVKTLDTTFNNEKTYIYLQLNVNKEGYFNGKVTLEETNFTLEGTESSYVNKIENNTITLNQINAGTTAEIKIKVKPVQEEYYKAGLLNVASKLNLEGIYRDSTQKDISIKATRDIKLNLIENNTSENVLNQLDLITNRIIKIDGQEKRMIQFSYNLGLQDNNYPIKEINSKLNIPTIDEKQPQVSVSTNLNSMTDSDYNYDAESLTINLKNQITDNGDIIWKSTGTENVVITCIYDKDTKLDNIKVTAEEKINLYNDKELTSNVETTIDEEEKDSIIQISTKNSNDTIYKGKIYSGIDRKYIETTQIKVNYAKAIEYINFKENGSNYIVNDKENKANIVFNKTIISKAQFDKIFGQNGVITIYNENKEKIAEITNSTEVNNDGNIEINYENNLPETLEFITTAPIDQGILELNHMKTIQSSNKEIVKRSTELKTKVTSEYNMKNSENYSKGDIKEADSTIILENTQTKARLEVNKDTLSTVVTNNVEIKAVLISNNEQYDLYKNPELTFVLPEEVETISINSIDLMYGEELKIKNYTVNGRTIKVYLDGEQTKYTETTIEGSSIIINADITVNKKSATKDQVIQMTYYNENAITYENEGNTTQNIRIVAPKDVTAIQSIKDLSVETIGQEESKKVMVQRGIQEKQLDVQIEIINNNENTIENVKMLGDFPTNYNSNNMGIQILSEITLNDLDNTKIYYSENENATEDLTNTENSWSETIKDASKVKKYLILIEKIEAQTSIEGSYKISIPANLEYNQTAKTVYQVKNTNSETKVESTVNSTAIELETGIGPKAETKLIATMAGKEINGPVKNGEVIKYKIEVSNVGTEDISNIIVTGQVPEGTTMVEPEENYEYTGASYYKELSDKTYTNKIDTLKVGEVVYKEYEVRVNKGVKAETNLTNVTQIKYGDVTKESNKVENITANGNLMVNVKRVTDRTVDLYTAGTVQYFAIIENISDSKQENVKVRTNLQENLEVTRLLLITGMGKEEVSDDDIHRVSNSNSNKSENKEISEQELTSKTSDENIKSEILEYNNEINIGSLEPGEVKVVSYDMKINKSQNDNTQIDFSVVVKNGEDEYNSNNWEDNVKHFEIDLNMTSSTQNQHLKAGDVVEYEITVENKSASETAGLVIKDKIPSQLAINKIMIDGETIKEDVNNDVEISMTISANNKVTIKIEAVVNYSEARDQAEAITNVAYAEVFGTKVASTPEVSNIIEANEGSTDNKGDGSNNDTDNNDIAQGNRTITGLAWYDENANGQRDGEEKALNNIKVRLLNVDTNNLVKDKSGEVVEVTTNENGIYVLDKVSNGKYIVIFDYDDTQYGLTKYKVEGISESENSNAMINELVIENQKQQVASTDIIELNNENISNINIGFIKLQKFDLKLDKYVSKIIIQNSKGTTVKEYNNETMAKAEIDAKQIQGSNVIIEYNIIVTNVGEVEGYAKKIADYMPSSLKFSSELNKDWYQTGDTLYSSSIANEKIKAGESKILTLTLTKAMTENDTGLINNRAEIAEDYNELGIADINSVPGNQAKDENDLGSAEVILSIRTGGAIYITATIITIVVLAVATVVIIKNKKYKDQI